MEKITALREKIDKVDEKILLLLKERIEISKRIGEIKHAHGAPIRDFKREEKKYKQIAEKSLELGLNPQEIRNIYQKIIEMSVHVQEENY